MAQQQKTSPKNINVRKKKKKKKQQQPLKRPMSSSLDSYMSFVSNYRPNSGSLTSSSGTLISSIQSSSKSSHGSSDKSAAKSESLTLKRKADRGPLKVSINETAELIEDCNEKSTSSDERSRSEEHEDAL